MSFADEILEFKKLQREDAKTLLTPGCVWATVKDVDWDKKTMTATGVEDELDYFNVQLGLGAYYRKPEVGKLVMLGVPGLQGSDTFLIECEAFEEAIFVSGESTFVIKEEGFIVKQGAENLRTILDDYDKQFGKLCDEVNKIVVSIGVTPNVAAITLIKTEVTQTINSRMKTVLKEN
ncbi:MAG: hypothetical protein JJE55_06840 [Flavobacteriaceae bacterium]|nr:hypothetical protein [Flavobacteriaceae bacterium]